MWIHFVFLGLDIGLGEQEGTWLVHQQSYIHAFLQEMFGEYLKDRPHTKRT